MIKSHFRYVILSSVLIGYSVSAEIRRVTTTSGNAPESHSSAIKIPNTLSVPAQWKSLLDPSTDVFWSEGNFKPDEGFLLWAKNPSIENAKLYLIRMNAKRDRIHLMQKQQEVANRELISQGVIKDDYNFLTPYTKSGTKNSTLSTDLNRLHIFFLFNPACPHCKKQAETLRGMSHVTPMQVGGKELINLPGLPSSVWATQEDIKKYTPNGTVPMLLLYDSTSNKIASLTGVQTRENIDRASALLIKGAPHGK